MMFGIICSKVLQEKRLLRGHEVAKGDKCSWCGHWDRRTGTFLQPVYWAA